MRPWASSRPVVQALHVAVSISCSRRSTACAPLGAYVAVAGTVTVPRCCCRRGAVGSLARHPHALMDLQWDVQARPADRFRPDSASAARGCGRFCCTSRWTLALLGAGLLAQSRLAVLCGRRARGRRHPLRRPADRARAGRLRAQRPRLLTNMVFSVAFLRHHARIVPHAMNRKTFLGGAAAAVGATPTQPFLTSPFTPTCASPRCVRKAARTAAIRHGAAARIRAAVGYLNDQARVVQRISDLDAYDDGNRASDATVRARSPAANPATLAVIGHLSAAASWWPNRVRQADDAADRPDRHR